jgi:hypothetical protein
MNGRKLRARFSCSHAWGKFVSASRIKGCEEERIAAKCHSNAQMMGTWRERKASSGEEGGRRIGPDGHILLQRFTPERLSIVRSIPDEKKQPQILNRLNTVRISIRAEE